MVGPSTRTSQEHQTDRRPVGSLMAERLVASFAQVSSCVSCRGRSLSCARGMLNGRSSNHRGSQVSPSKEIPIILPTAAGVFRWPWWMIAVCGAISVFGCFVDNPETVEFLRARDGLLLAAVLEFVWTTTVCAALFGMGRVLRLI